MSLKGFEDITAELSEADKKLIPIFLAGFRKHIGPHNPIKNRQIVAALAKKNVELTEVKVRKIINYIRTHSLLPGLVATSSGYYITSDPNEIKKYIQSLLGRESEIRKIREATQEYYKTVIYKKQSYLNF